MAAVHKIDYEMVALELGNALKMDVTIDKVSRNAQAILKVYRRAYKNSYISSAEANAVYDYVLSLRDSRLDDSVKLKRLVEFIRALVKEDSADLPRLLGHCGVGEAAFSQMPDFKRLVHDDALSAVFTERWREAERCVTGKACLAAVLMMGSLLEGVLLAKVIAEPQAASQSPAAPKINDGKLRQFHEWTLVDLINVAHSCGWIKADTESFGQALRTYKNFIHPWHQVAHIATIGDIECAENWEVVRAVVTGLVNKDG